MMIGEICMGGIGIMAFILFLLMIHHALNDKYAELRHSRTTRIFSIGLRVVMAILGLILVMLLIKASINLFCWLFLGGIL